MEDWYRRRGFQDIFIVLFMVNELARYFPLFFPIQKSYGVSDFRFWRPKCHLEEKKEAGSLTVARSVKWRRKGHFNSVDPKLQFSIFLAVEAEAGA